MEKKSGVGRAEAEVLRFIADNPGATISTVGDHLLKAKGQTRTTALNTMERLRSKGYVRREQVDGLYHYYPTGGKAKLLNGLVDDFVETFLGGSVTPLVAYLTQKAEADPSEIAELRKLLDSLSGDDHVS